MLEEKKSHNHHKTDDIRRSLYCDDKNPQRLSLNDDKRISSDSTAYLLEVPTPGTPVSPTASPATGTAPLAELCKINVSGIHVAGIHYTQVYMYSYTCCTAGYCHRTEINYS